MFVYEFDYRKAFDVATRAWAREKLATNAAAGPFEGSAVRVLSSINTMRDAYGLSMLRLNRAHNDIAEDHEL